MIKSTKHLKTLSLVLTKVEKPLYDRNSLLSTPDELPINACKKGHANSLNDSAYSSDLPRQSVDHTSTTGAKEVINRKRKVIPVVMADGEIFCRPVRKRKHFDTANHDTLSLNCNANNNESNELLSHDDHVTGLPCVLKNPANKKRVRQKEKMGKKGSFDEDMPLMKRGRGRPKKVRSIPEKVRGIPEKVRGRPKKVRYGTGKFVSAAMNITQTFENEKVTIYNESFLSGNHVIHPVYISPGLPNEGHTPIIIMQGEEDNYSEKLETDNATNTIQIQENVDNVLHEESVRLNEAVLDSSRDNNDVRVEKEEECLVQEEFVPFENMDDEELLLGPWGEVLTGVPPPSTIGIDLQQLIEEDDRDEVITVLDAGYVTKDVSIPNEHVTMTIDVLTPPKNSNSIFGPVDINTISPFSSSMALDTIKLNDCINDMGIAVCHDLDGSEIVNALMTTNITTKSSNDQVVDVMPTTDTEAPPIINTEAPPIINTEAPTIINTEAPTIINTEAPPIINTEAPPIINTEAPPIINTEAPTIINTEAPPIINTEAPPIINTEALTIINTEAPPIINTEAPPIINTEAPPIINTEAPPIINTEAPPIINTEAPTIINTEAPPIINTEAPPIINTEAPPIINTEAPPIINTEAPTIINTEAYPIVNDETSPIGNGKTPIVTGKKMPPLNFGDETPPLVTGKTPSFTFGDETPTLVIDVAFPVADTTPSRSTEEKFKSDKTKKNRIKKKKIVYKITKKKRNKDGHDKTESKNVEDVDRGKRRRLKSPSPIRVVTTLDNNGHTHLIDSTYIVSPIKTTPTLNEQIPVTREKKLTTNGYHDKVEGVAKERKLLKSMAGKKHISRNEGSGPYEKEHECGDHSNNNGCGQNNLSTNNNTLSNGCGLPNSKYVVKPIDPTCSTSFTFNLNNLVRTTNSKEMSLFTTRSNTSLFQRSPPPPAPPASTTATTTASSNIFNLSKFVIPRTTPTVPVSPVLSSSHDSILSNPETNDRKMIMIDTDAISLFVDESLDSISDDQTNNLNHIQKWVAEQQRDPPPIPPSIPLPFSPITSPPLSRVTSLPLPPSIPLPLSCVTSLPLQPPPFYMPPCSPVSPPYRVSHSHTHNGHPLGPPPRWSQARRSRFPNSILELPPRPVSVTELNLIDPSLRTIPTASISRDTINKYVCEFNVSRSQLDKYKIDIVTLLKALLKDDYLKAATTFIFLRIEKDVQFDYKVLGALLFLCSVTTVTKPPSPVITAFKAFNDLRKIGAGRVDPLDYTHLMYTLANCNKINDLLALYTAAADHGVKSTPEHFCILASKANLLGGHRVLQILNDAKFCLSDDDAIRFSEHILESVDRCILTSCPHLLVNWIKSSPSIVKRLSLNKIELLLSVFVERREWQAGVTLLDCCSNMIPNLGKNALKTIEYLSSPMCHETKYLLNFIMELLDEQIRALPSHIWCNLLQCGLNMKILPVSCWLYKTATRLKQHVSNKMMLQLISLLIDHNCTVPLFSIQRSFLSRSNLEVAELTKLCELCQSDQFTEHLFMTCHSMIDHKLPPPLHSLNWLLDKHVNTEKKMYESLANLIKQALFRKVVLGYEFYERVLVELRGWGKDLPCLDIVYKCLRRKNGVTDNDDCNNQLRGRREQEPSSGFGSLPVTQESSSCSSISLSPLTDFGMGPSPDHQIINNADVNDPCYLIKQYGRKKQYGNIAAILTGLRANKLYSTGVLQTCVSMLITDSSVFGKLVNSIITARNEKLSPDDHWLVGQLGVTLLCHYHSSCEWDDGFLILLCLHANGIHYVSVLPPHAMTPHPTPCSVAMKAVYICLKINKLDSALEVLNACQCVQGSSDQENMDRGQMLLELATKCVEANRFFDACKCLTNVLAAVPRPLYQKLSETVTNVLSCVLEKELIVPSVGVVKEMISKNISLGSDLCNLVVVKLIELGQNEEARSIVNGAIELGWYQQVETTPYSLVLPPTMTDLEINQLIWHHALIMPHPPSHPLEILCSSGLSYNVERSLETVFTPPLLIMGRSNCSSSRVCLSVSYKSLCAWSNDYHTTGKLKIKDKKKMYRRELCKAVADNMKCYYQEKRFVGEDDYKHLISIIYNHFLHSPTSSQWILTNKIQDDIRSMVGKIMNSCTTYNKDHDIANVLTPSLSN